MDSGMRGPYKVMRALPHDRYELELLAGWYGKKTQTAAERMAQWRGEWTPDACEAFFGSKSEDQQGDDQRDGTQITDKADEAVQLSGKAVLEDSPAKLLPSRPAYAGGDVSEA